MWPFMHGMFVPRGLFRYALHKPPFPVHFPFVMTLVTVPVGIPPSASSGLAASQLGCGS